MARIFRSQTFPQNSYIRFNNVVKGCDENVTLAVDVDCDSHRGIRDKNGKAHYNFAFLDVLVTAMKKSLTSCSISREDICSLDISWPADVRHVSHVTFDRFNGFLGLPDEFEPEVPRRAPSASASVFGVSAKSMQCSYDQRGNSVPTILLKMQRHLYSQGGLNVEGIFRINAENSQEESVRSQLNQGIIPQTIDIHCLAGLIKAWFRELPTGILDSLSPEQVMRSHNEEDCTRLVKMLPFTEASLLDWVINLMADVVMFEHRNKMNAHSIAVIFAPNMTQMEDPIIALIHAVKVMNILKILVVKALRERKEVVFEPQNCSCPETPSDRSNSGSLELEIQINEASNDNPIDNDILHKIYPENMSSTPKRSLESEGRMIPPTQNKETFDEFLSIRNQESNDEIEISRTVIRVDANDADRVDTGSHRGYNSSGEVEGILHWLRYRSVRKLCRRPVLQLSKSFKKSRVDEIVNSNEGREACA